MEIQKSPRWRHLYSHKQSIDTKYGYSIPVSWFAVAGRATDGPPHFVIMLNLYWCKVMKVEVPKDISEFEL